jgi:hypothetical protein
MRSMKRWALAGVGAAIVAGSLLTPTAHAVSEPPGQGQSSASTLGKPGTDGRRRQE